MTRSTSTVIAGCLAVVVVLLGYQLYQEHRRTSGVEIRVGDEKLSIETK